MKQALVLSGGGSKGAYEAGCIKALRELDFHYDIVTGTSIGALNGLLVVQQDYEPLEQLWKTLSIEKVLTDPIHFDFSIESLMKNTDLIRPFFKSYLNKKGADNEPFINLVRGMYKSDAAMNSPMKYGCCTVAFPQLKPLEITIDSMNKDNVVEYALASASCFPAFPVHDIDGQGYIDGGYYDNLPIHLAFEMGATDVLAIELNQEATHPFLLNREHIQFIRPSHPLGGFLDFSRDVMDWRMNLGYLDTYKKFGKLYGHLYAFSKDGYRKDISEQFYNDILQYELNFNHHTFTVGSETPLLNVLKKDTYIDHLSIEDYLIRGCELYMKAHDYPTDQLYHFDDIIRDIQELDINKDELSKLDFIKKAGSSLIDLTNKQLIHYYVQQFDNPDDNISFPENLFMEEYLIAMFIHLVKTIS